MEYIWSFEQLASGLQHPDADHRRWAAERLYTLYPEQAEIELETRLLSEDDALILPSLAFLMEHRNEACRPHLKQLYLNGSDQVVIKILQIAAVWQLAEVVQWVQEKISRSDRLSPEQIDAMIGLLGKIRTDEAYRLLKATERSVKQREAQFYDRYYSALLAHHRPEDLDTVMTDAFDPGGLEKTRIAALSILLWETDPGLRASDVFFANTSWVNEYLRTKAERLFQKVPAAAAVSVEKIAPILDQLTPETVSAQVRAVADLAAAGPEDGDWVSRVAQVAGVYLQRSQQAPETCYAVSILALSARLAGLEQKSSALADPGADWRDRLVALCRLRPINVGTDPEWNELAEQGSAEELSATLESVLAGDPNSLAGLNATMALGKLRALSTIASLLRAWEKKRDIDFEGVLELALCSMGPAAVPELMVWLETCPAESRPLILRVCSHYPTTEVIRAFLKHLDEFYRNSPEAALQAIARTGSGEFLTFLQEEYREGEAELGKTFLQVCRANGVEPEPFTAVARDVKRLAKLAEIDARADYLGPDRFPSFLTLKLVCRRCQKHYQYQVHSIHVHPQAPEELQQRHRTDLTPYRQGLVIGDSLCCKDCGAWNEFRLSEASFSAVMAHSLRLSVLRRGKVPIPASYPIEYVSYEEKDGKPRSLLEIERDLQNAVLRAPKQARTHLALAKFYEYVKVLDESKKSYLMALNLDPLCLEAMAGLARLAELATRYREAFEWCDRCFENLSAGRVFLTESFDDFKKTVREKRREYARLAGIKPDRDPVEIRFRIETPAHPKNKPCPCGSGKKYKLCCMKKDQQQGG